VHDSLETRYPADGIEAPDGIKTHFGWCVTGPVPASAARQEPLALELSAFLAAARGEAKPAVSIHDGARAVILADAVLESARGGGIPVRPKLEAIAAV